MALGRVRTRGETGPVRVGLFFDNPIHKSPEAPTERRSRGWRDRRLAQSVGRARRSARAARPVTRHVKNPPRGGGEPGAGTAGPTQSPTDLFRDHGGRRENFAPPAVDVNTEAVVRCRTSAACGRSSGMSITFPGRGADPANQRDKSYFDLHPRQPGHRRVELASRTATLLWLTTDAQQFAVRAARYRATASLRGAERRADGSPRVVPHRPDRDPRGTTARLQRRGRPRCPLLDRAGATQGGAVAIDMTTRASTLLARGRLPPTSTGRVRPRVERRPLRRARSPPGRVDMRSTDGTRPIVARLVFVGELWDPGDTEFHPPVARQTAWSPPISRRWIPGEASTCCSIAAAGSGRRCSCSARALRRASRGPGSRSSSPHAMAYRLPGLRHPGPRRPAGGGKRPLVIGIHGRPVLARSWGFKVRTSGSPTALCGAERGIPRLGPGSAGVRHRPRPRVGRPHARTI